MFRATAPEAPSAAAPPPAATDTDPARTSASIVWLVSAQMWSALAVTLEPATNACAPLEVPTSSHFVVSE